MIAVATYIQQKCKQKPIIHQLSSVIAYDALNGLDPIGLTEIKNTAHDRLAHCRNAALYVRNKGESDGFCVKYR